MYSLLVLAISYRRPSHALVADVSDALGAIDTYADGSPVTERCPVSPPVAERRIQVEVAS